MLLRIWKKGNPCTLLVEIQIGSVQYRKQYGSFSKKKKKKELLSDPLIPLLGIYPKEMKTGYQKDICNPVFIAVLFTTTKIRKQAMYLSTDEQIKKTYAQWNTSQPRERRKSCHFQQGWTWGHCAKECRSHGERQTLYGVI